MNLKDKDLSNQLTRLEEDIKRRKFESSHLVATRIISYFNQVISHATYDNPNVLLQYVLEIGQKLQRADKLNFVVPNTIKRILHVIREAQAECKFSKDDDPTDLKGLADFGRLNIVKERVSNDDSMMFEQSRMKFEEGGRKQLTRKTTYIQP